MLTEKDMALILFQVKYAANRVRKNKKKAKNIKRFSMLKKHPISQQVSIVLDLLAFLILLILRI
jgi:hypothetical protein